MGANCPPPRKYRPRIVARPGIGKPAYRARCCRLCQVSADSFVNRIEVMTATSTALWKSCIKRRHNLATPPSRPWPHMLVWPGVLRAAYRLALSICDQKIRPKEVRQASNRHIDANPCSLASCQCYFLACDAGGTECGRTSAMAKHSTTAPADGRAMLSIPKGGAHVDLQAMRGQTASFGIATRHCPPWRILSLSAMRIPQ